MVTAKYRRSYCRSCYNAYQKASRWPQFQTERLTMKHFKEYCLQLMIEAGEAPWAVDAPPVDEPTPEYFAHVEEPDYGNGPGESYEEFLARFVATAPTNQARNSDTDD